MDSDGHGWGKGEVVVASIGGNCPVQAEGTVDGAPFYFRARGNSWSMSIGAKPVEVCCGQADGWHMHRQWGDEPFAAGWMPVEEAMRLIREAAEAYASDLFGSGAGR